jgi:hypothetical protein
MSSAFFPEPATGQLERSALPAEAAAFGLARGERIADFALPVADGRLLMFCEFAAGKPMLVAGCGAHWSAAQLSALVAIVRERASADDLQAIVLCDPGRGTESSDLRLAVAIDAGGQLRRRLFGAPGASDDGHLMIADANLRMIDGCSLARDALGSGADRQGLLALVREAKAVWDQEIACHGGYAPVLIVPRVLPEELCCQLIDGFQRWGPRDSPMPTPSGPALQLDATRKSRLDATIGEPAIEAETLGWIATCVLPELRKAFFFEVGGIERLKLVCYRASAGGHFAVHRDNSAPQTAHRRFALTVNLNTGAYEGGELEFPDYGYGPLYTSPPGGAIVFSCAHAHRVRPVSAGERYALIGFMSAAASTS